jgi:hypothetical protein
LLFNPPPEAHIFNLSAFSVLHDENLPCSRQNGLKRPKTALRAGCWLKPLSQRQKKQSLGNRGKSKPPPARESGGVLVCVFGYLS